ncbi:uncharacterized protein LOC108744245 [Agrilus planipennis]|uniref:Uncharacterized protein LOC108744245 n=1 Tax=Agrilus planipennis TaxID=224129 RepID=A0A1W4XRM2_AGRPL|nr:uncharacterized protein LOC108744245 [Agrilus planipennis]
MRKTILFFILTSLLYWERLSCKNFVEVEDDPNTLIVDLRECDEIENSERVCGNVNIPLKTLRNVFKTMSSDQFLKHFGLPKPGYDSAIIFFHYSPKKSFQASSIMENMGYKNLHVYDGTNNDQGITKRPMSVVGYEDVVQVEGDPEVLIVDVRDRHEVANSGRIRGSVNIPLAELELAFSRMSETEFKKNYGRSKPGRDFPIVFSCQAGVRSTQAMRIMQRIGYKNLYNYSGGWQDYKARKGWK